LFGVTDQVLPSTYQAFIEYVREMEQSELLTVGDQARGLARYVLDPPVPTVLKVTRPPLTALTAALLPDRLRHQFGVRWGVTERALAGAAARAVHSTIGTWPHRVRYWDHYRTACRRVGIATPRE
jgi:uncharacterized protein (DUF2236 family)